MASPKKSASWQEMRRQLASKSQKELLDLIRDLYALHPEVKDFLHARFLISARNLRPYKKTIQESLYPDVIHGEDIDLERGRKAINDYQNATNDLMQALTLDGSWQESDHHLQFTGTLSSSALCVILSLLKYGETFHYMKHAKSDALVVPLILYQMKSPNQNRYQHTLSIAHSVNLSAHSEGRLSLSGDLPMTFDSGQVCTFALDTQHQPFICLLAIAKVDVISKRNTANDLCVRSKRKCWVG